MKKFILDRQMWCNLLLMLVAVLCGGGAMAVTTPEVGEHGSDTDPNDGNPLEGATKDAPDMGIDQQGAGSTGSAMEEAGLDDAQIDDYVMKYEAWKYPLHTDYMKLARKAEVKTKTPMHPVIGEAILEAKTKAALTNTEKAHQIDLPLYGNDMKIFPEKGTIRVFGQTGYDEKGVSDGSPLMLYVTANERGTKVTVMAVNGPINNGETYVPDIPAGTKLRAMASALSESELRVASDNFLPGWRQAYLQKKACAITRTDFYDKMKKQVKFGGQQVKDAVLSTFRKKCTSTLLVGAKGKTTKFSDVTGTEENVYFQEGILPQLQNSYQLAGLPTFADLIAITRMTCTKYAKSNIVQAYCGSLFMEWLSNIDYSKHPEVQFTSKRDALNVKVGKFETNFGTIEFKLDYGLDENAMEGNAIIFPMGEAIAYTYEKKTVSHDHKNDTEARDAKSEYYIVDDCLMLTGLTSLFVGQDVTAAGQRSGNYQTSFVSVPAISSIESPDAGKVYYLTQQDGDYVLGAYIYRGGKWELWEGMAKA